MLSPGIPAAASAGSYGAGFVRSEGAGGRRWEGIEVPEGRWNWLGSTGR